ncbi:MAG: ABC-F family ATP-binding cassette domain-containing protein [Bacteroidaceae bacterium]|nr:ABC-F family ATP-binding cassette domain-containing protein [Bacteroidaceae bacterium]
MANAYLTVQNLTYGVGDKVLFADVSFGISEGQHVGLIARNGIGKTSLLNLLTGHDQPDSGSIIYRNGLRVGYLEQSPVYPENLTVKDACLWKCPPIDELHEEPEERERRIEEALSRLQITDHLQLISQLSGGQLKRVALANVLIQNPDFLILDEPTNHLDIRMIEWLEEYLGRRSLTLLMVTHDRFFLDRVCDIILELDNQQLYTYRGNYAYFLEKRQQRMDNLNAEIARASNLYRTELEWMRRMPQARGHKARYRENAFYDLERKAHQQTSQQDINLQVKSTYIGSKIFEAEYVSKAFGDDHIILKDFYYNFSRYEKMGIVGANGTGKSTFIKLLLGLVKPDSGRFVVGETVRFGYYSQEGMHFDQQMKVIDAVRRVAEYVDLGGGRHLTAMQLLQHFMFSPLQQQNYIYKLSGGERRRLYLCTVLMQNPNFLILDEPTNDLDITTLNILEQYLRDFKGCVIVVSHDRFFMDKVVDHLLVFNGQGRVQDFPGNYSQYREWLKEHETQERKQQRTATNKTSSERRSATQRERRLSYKERLEMASLEKEIATLGEERQQIEQALSSGTLTVAELTEKSRRLPQLIDELDAKEMRWLELSEIGE